jgi:hypothetical protein
MSKSFAIDWRPAPERVSKRRGLGTRFLPGITLLVLLPGVVRAQVVPGEGTAIGALGADRARVSEITGRSAGTVDTLTGSFVVLPTLRTTWNSALPNGGNDGGMWAGRGVNLSITGGISYRRRLKEGLLTVVFAPELRYSQNRAFGIIPGTQPGRSVFSSPWHTGQESADLPLRFGVDPIRAIGPGQSEISFTTDRVRFGLSSTSEWWGPALRNTLLLGNNAAGVPRLFASTSRPVRTRAGNLEGRIIIGGLSESPYFDEDAGNDVRSLSGLLLLFHPAIDSGLTIGLSRLVIANAGSAAATVPHVLDALFHFEPIRRASDTTDAGRSYQRTDQLISLFGRWVFSSSGFETYVEWARMELPHSIHEYLSAPQHSQGYTLGLQWADPAPRTGRLRVQAEVTNLEQTEVLSGRRPPDFYSGRGVPQGFTQRGQVLGAPIGPGASSQFLAMDWLAPAWQAGLFAGRTRNENDALYRTLAPRNEQHDVTIYSGVRGGVRLRGFDVATELTVGRRINYLFQSDFYLGQPVDAVDIQNVTLTFVVSPRPGHPRERRALAR